MLSEHALLPGGGSAVYGGASAQRTRVVDDDALHELSAKILPRTVSTVRLRTCTHTLMGQ